MSFHGVRVAVESDGPEISRLLTLLGHVTTGAEVKDRWAPWVSEGNVAFVAPASNGTLSGLITLHRMRVLHRQDPVGRITALVVDAPMRGLGLGRTLVTSAERTLRTSGCRLLEVTSHERFAEAHDFYRHLGYEQTSRRFAKILGP